MRDESENGGMQDVRNLMAESEVKVFSAGAGFAPFNRWDPGLFLAKWIYEQCKL